MSAIAGVSSPIQFNELDQDPSEMTSSARKTFCGHLWNPYSKLSNKVAGHSIWLGGEFVLGVIGALTLRECKLYGCGEKDYNAGLFFFGVGFGLFIPHGVYAGYSLLKIWIVWKQSQKTQ